MSSAELASMADTLEQVSRRIATIARAHETAKKEDIAGALYDIERAVINAQRRLDKLLRESSARL